MSERDRVIAIMRSQLAVCTRFGVEHYPAPPSLKMGVAENVGSGLQPLNGLRHPPYEGTTGWFVWAGEEFSTADDFFQPMHAVHIEDLAPEVLPYLGLPPGWRFLLAPGYEDVWYDPNLLHI